ncbi:non-hemolytic enterotoxin subunit C [Cerasibacillus sp. JNUCC 74]
MRKEWLKKMILSLIAVGIITSHIAPQQTFADVSIQQEDEYDFGPGKLADELTILTSNAYILNSHAMKMFAQNVPDLKNIALIDRELKDKLYSDQVNSKMNGREWLVNIKPLLTTTSQNIVGYNETFQSHYNNLTTALRGKNIENFKSELSLLYNEILDNKEQVDNLSRKLISFRDDLTRDTNNFKSNFNQLTSIITSTNAGVPLLKKEIERYYEEIKLGEGLIVSGSLLCASLVGMAAGIPMIHEGKSMQDNAYSNIEQLKQRISGIEKEVTVLTDIKNNFTRMSEIIDSAITSLHNISTHWYTIASNYRIILRNIDSINPERLTFIENKLNTAKNNWENLKESADRMRESLTK